MAWRFDTNYEAPANGEPVTPGKHWNWKMKPESGYPFPLLWWQAKHLDAAAGSVSPDTGAKLQWWETTVPAINEEWIADPTYNAGGYVLNIPHSFPEGDGGN